MITISDKGMAINELIAEQGALLEKAQVLNNQIRALHADYDSKLKDLSLQQYQILDMMAACEEAMVKIARTV